MSLRTPLGKVLGLGSAKEGTDHWWGQRVSAVALVILGLWFMASMAQMDHYDYLTVVKFVAQPLNSVLLAILSVVLCYHSYLGVQVVIEDYIHGPAAKISMLLLSRFAHVLIAIISVFSILRIGVDV